MIWNPSVECMDRESMRKLQSERLRKVVERVYNNCEPYRKRMEEAGVTPEDINSIDDIVKLPFTSKKDLRDYYPFGLLSAPKEEIIRIKTTVPNDKIEMIKEVENHFENEFGNLERLYRKVETI